jgi:HEAT repeat protein
LAFLPLANDDAVEREIRAALRALALRDGKPDPTLVQALEDKDPLRQSAAAEALGKVPLPPGRKIIIEGVKRPMKAEVFRDGAVFMTREVLEVTYFNKLDDKLFAMP